MSGLKFPFSSSVTSGADSENGILELEVPKKMYFVRLNDNFI